jgi:protein-L-isoaspartate(D-aspartate) O-methyltransferase
MNDDGFMTKDALLQHLEEGTQVFKNPAVKAAFVAVDRKDFVGDDYAVEAYEDYLLPIPDGQTIPQPTTVAFMLELLDAQLGDNVLNVGAGSGWTTALLGHMVGAEGSVVGLEVRPLLVEFGQTNIKKYPKLPISILQATEDSGLFKQGPYNRILSSAAFQTKEDKPIMELLFQLSPGGVMVVPIGDSLFKFEKLNDDKYYETEYPGFSFLPYV